MVALPADYRSAAATAMVAVLREIAEEWVAGRAGLRENLAVR
jgi:hypothetical protein